MYLEIDPLGSGKGMEPAVLISTPGLKFQQSIGVGPIRCTYTQSNIEVSWVVSGDRMYKIAGASAIPVLIPGALNTSDGPVQMSDNGTDLVIVDGQFGYVTDSTSLTPDVKLITNVHFHATDTITFQDGYFIGVDKGTGNFFLSDLYSTDWLPLNEANASGASDILIAAISVNRQLYLLGAKSTEIWWDSGQSGSTPFQRQDGRFSQVGCAAPHSVAVVGETFMWLGSNAQGGGIVYSLENAMPTRVSTHAIEFAIQEFDSLSGATAYSYQQEGHYFYLLNIPGSPVTWVYDVANGQWHERESTHLGNSIRHIGQTHCLLNGQHVVGDYRNGNIYTYDLDVYTDNGQTVNRIRQTPHVSDSLNRIFYKLFEVDMQFGVGLDNLSTNTDEPTPGSDPRIVLEISNDGGATWGNPIYASIGKIGRYKTRARWLRLGSSRDRVFRVIVSEPVRCTMLSAMLDVEVGEG
jgi:hypothetical protein